jgi:hypothetical protein
MAVLVDLFGPPSSDQLYESPFKWEGYEGWAETGRGVDACHRATVPIFGGYGCFDYIRRVSWGDVGLWVVFSDLMVNEDADPGGDGYWLQVPPSLRGYVYGAGDTGPSARTAQGIAVGSTVKDLRALGDEVTFGQGCGDDLEFTINDPDSTSGGSINGYLPGTDSEAFRESGYINPDATVSSLNAGAQRSC